MSEVVEVHDKDHHSYTFSSKDGKPIARIVIENVHEEREIPWGEVSIYYLMEGQNEPVSEFKRLNLTTDKQPGVEALRIKAPVWAELPYEWYERAVASTVRAHRKPITTHQLVERSQLSSDSGFLIDPLILGRGVSLLFAQGGTGKSFIALAMCVAVASGREIMGMKPSDTGACLYVDYEDDIQSHELRLGAILRGAGIAMSDMMYPIRYMRPTRPLAKIRRPLDGVLRDVDPRLVIVDSVALARGGDANTSEDTIRAFATMHQFDTSVLALDHVTKEDVRGKKVITPYGSVYTINSVRLAWGMTAREASDDTNTWLDMVQTKRNNVARHEPLAIHMKFHNEQREVGELGSVQPVLTRVDLGLLDGYGQPKPQTVEKPATRIEKIVAHLEDNGTSTTGGLSVALGDPDVNSIGGALRREAKKVTSRVERVPDTEPTEWKASYRLKPLPLSNTPETEETQ